MKYYELDSITFSYLIFRKHIFLFMEFANYALNKIDNAFLSPLKLIEAMNPLVRTMFRISELIRFKQTCFVSTRLDIAGSPLSIFARCLFLSLEGPASGVVSFIGLHSLWLMSSFFRHKPTQPTLCGGLDWCVCDFPLREGGIWDN